MCGISDFAFRTMCRRHAGSFAYTQMVAARGISTGDPKTLDILDLQGGEPLLGMQLFGSDPGELAVSATKLEALGATSVDLNMGCPARKVTAGQGGSALLRTPELAREIFRAMRAALSVPFTVKMRWDFDDDLGSALHIAQMAEEEGVDGLCLHARTRGEGYSGEADWSRIRRLKQSVSIPVIGNGDVRSPADAVEMMRATGCDAVMIGRAAIGDPWLLGQALAAVAEGSASPERTMPSWEERRRGMLRHARLMTESKGMRSGIVQFRKHAAAYIRGVHGARAMRPRLMQVSDLDALAEVLPAEDPGLARAGEPVSN